MPGGHNPFALASEEWNESEEAEIVQSPSAKPRGKLRKRARSLKQPRLPALRTQLADELHMRFWSLGHGTKAQDGSDSGALWSCSVMLSSVHMSAASADEDIHGNREAHGPRST